MLVGATNLYIRTKRSFWTKERAWTPRVPGPWAVTSCVGLAAAVSVLFSCSSSRSSRADRKVGPLRALRALEVELNRETRETRAQQPRCLSPLLDDRCRRVVCDVVVVLIRPDRVVVEQVVDIDADVDALGAEAEVLSELQVELRVALAVHLTRVEQVHLIRRLGDRRAGRGETA